jgi:peptidoglycan/xylan/chitin deacetylase (PgdA/CDA1 family)
VLPNGFQPRDAALDGSLVSVSHLRRQLRLLKSRYYVIAPEDVLQWLDSEETIPTRSVLLTCDDGLHNVLSDMLPVLLEEGVRCLFFVTGASAADHPSMLWYEELYLLLMASPATKFSFPDLKMRGEWEGLSQRRSAWWTLVKELSRYSTDIRRSFLRSVREQSGLSETWQVPYRQGANRRRYYVLMADELRRLASAGMSIGAHTLDHPLLANAPPEIAWQEIAESRNALSTVLEKPVWAMAYPFGNSGSAGPREFEMAERAGYKCAFLNFGGPFRSDISRFAIPRVHVTADMHLAELEAHISGFYSALRQRYCRAGENFS